MKKYLLAVSVCAIIGALVIAPAVQAASQNSGRGSVNKGKRAVEQALETRKGERPMQMVQINPNGKAILRGSVESINGETITVKSWGGTWTVRTSAATKHTPNKIVRTGTTGSVKGDIDKNGIVDKKDYALLQINFGRTSSNGVIALSTFDLDKNSIINDADVKLFNEQLNTKALNSAADFNKDGMVDTEDQRLLTTVLYTRVQSYSFSDVDVTGDGKINIDDFAQLSANFGTGTSSGAAVAVGDFVGVHGDVVAGSSFTIAATEIRNWAREGNIKIDKKELKKLKKLDKDSDDDEDDEDEDEDEDD